jgi:hypothetical protein
MALWKCYGQEEVGIIYACKVAIQRREGKEEENLSSGVVV